MIDKHEIIIDRDHYEALINQRDGLLDTLYMVKTSLETGANNQRIINLIEYELKKAEA